MSLNSSDVLARLERLERSNRRMRLVCLASLSVPLLTLVGWQTANPVAEILRVRRLEVVDERGVPLVTLGKERTGDGGSVVLRDRLGEKRSWWQVGPNSGAFAILSEDKDDQKNATAGISVGPRKAEISLFSGNGAALSAGVRNEQPRLDLWSSQGKNLFGAPWTTNQKR
jgi:hypothetical protein